MTVPVQLSLFEKDDSAGACVGFSLEGTMLTIRTTSGHDSAAEAARAGLDIARSKIPSDASLAVYDPTEALPATSDVTRCVDWSGAPCSSVVDHFAAYAKGDWTPPFPLEYGTSPTPPYDVYTDGTHTPREHQDADRATTGVGFVIAGSNDVMYACGVPAPHINDSLDSEYYAILSALATLDTMEDTTIHTDHRNVPTVADGKAPERCAAITDKLTTLFQAEPTLTIEYINRSATRLADGLATAGTREPVTLGTPP